MTGARQVPQGSAGFSMSTFPFAASQADYLGSSQSFSARTAYLMERLRATSEDERRQGRRRSLRCRMTLITCADETDVEPQTLCGEVLEIGDGGLYGIIPQGYGVCIGQRYNFEIAVGERGPEPGSHQIVTQQGTIVRTELLVGKDGQGDRVGIGVRLLGRRCGMVPMPERL